MVVQMGEGDHTWTETYAVDREVYDKIQEAEKNFRKTTTPKKPKVKPTEEEEAELSVLDELEEEETELSEDEYINDEDDYSSDDYTEDED
jgi:predicted Zn-dependent peptidase